MLMPKRLPKLARISLGNRIILSSTPDLRSLSRIETTSSELMHSKRDSTEASMPL